MNNFSAQKQGYFTKLNMSMKSLDNVIKEVKRFEEIYNASINEEIEESLVKKINFWMNLIKQDLSGDKNEILYRIENDKYKAFAFIDDREIFSCDRGCRIETDLNGKVLVKYSGF